MSNPYEKLPPRNFWKSAVGRRNALEIEQLWQPKFKIAKELVVATAGSCFAQHISRAMVKSGFEWLDSEPAPDWLSASQGSESGYGVFSFRTGNIYTTALLRQWIEMALGSRRDSPEIWEKDGRFFDPLRPAIEPSGFAFASECSALREFTLGAIERSLAKIDVFVFTLGLTEGWRNRQTGMVYPMCPGTLAGTFSDTEHEFHNQTMAEVMTDLEHVQNLLLKRNPAMKFLLTVSPVPLTATASTSHVLVASTYSKAVLRAVAGEIAARREDTDYFPSFEIISSAPFRGIFFEPNLRSVAPAGVEHVMSHFFAGLGLASEVTSSNRPSATGSDNGVVDETDVQCEEALLEAFAER